MKLRFLPSRCASRRILLEALPSWKTDLNVQSQCCSTRESRINLMARYLRKRSDSLFKIQHHAVKQVLDLLSLSLPEMIPNFRLKTDTCEYHASNTLFRILLSPRSVLFRESIILRNKIPSSKLRQEKNTFPHIRNRSIMRAYRTSAILRVSSRQASITRQHDLKIKIPAIHG